MNNFMISLRRFFKNKNTVTFLGLLLIIVILYFGYTTVINRQVEPRQIPVAAETINPRTQITSDMVKFLSVPSVSVSDNVITSKAKIVDKYTNYNTMIPEGSFFYTETVVNEDDLPDASFVDVKEGEVPYNFPVTIAKTYGNSIYPGNYIDIYMKALNENGELMVGKLIENVKVLAVKDSRGKNVFENVDETRTPAYIIFGLTPENNILLRKGSYMSQFSVELFPVPHGIDGSDDVEQATVVSSAKLQEFINANSVPNDELYPEDETPQPEDGNGDTNVDPNTGV